ncbi:unnamed protein product [Notodromas monacha]|uniref:Large ribosomal subunit protein uL29m n=1 Tax=Notodromas monacha TaxID=399045 RepID=A0A7R9GEK8_9CRUS|nr:unnamed protein product [Notodromas monacha]CAG0919839.1 unnamed protein product [Notodromas monacha]
MKTMNALLRNSIHLRRRAVCKCHRRASTQPAKEVTTTEDEPVVQAPVKQYCSEGVKGLMEFFDERSTWGQTEVKVGRSWRMPELRLKSNVDLHKLWYVLLKEKNMLITLEKECNDEARIFPNPERIDKIDESMKNVEDVVRERNRAYFELETGETGEQPGKWALSWLGLRVFHSSREYLVPKQFNETARKMLFYANRLDDGFRQWDMDVKYFHARIKEKEASRNAYWTRFQTETVIAVLKKFPNADLEAVQRDYPLADVEKILKSEYMQDLKLWQKLDREPVTA